MSASLSVVSSPSPLQLSSLNNTSNFSTSNCNSNSTLINCIKEASSPKKRKRNVLNIKDKCDIIQKIKEGKSIISISNEYNVCRSTIWGIKQSESKILKFSSQIGAAIHSRKTMKKSEDYNLDAAVYKWFQQQTRNGAALSNQMICDEALRLNKQFNGELEFKATRGWLRRFKARHDISSQNVAGKLRSTSTTDDVQSSVDTEDSFNLSRHTPTSGHSEVTTATATTVDDPMEGKRRNDSQMTTVSIKLEEPAEVIDDDDDVLQLDDRKLAEVETPAKPTDEEAFNAIDTVIQWAECEVNMDQLMFLRTLQSLAAKRALASISRGKLK